MNAADFIGQTIGSIRLHREIGHGSTGIVFAGYQESLGRPVAVKLYYNENVDYARREKETLSALSHPNIVPLLGTGAFKGYPYHVLPLIDGSSLRVLIRRHLDDVDPDKCLMPPATVIDIILPLLGALACIHEQGFVHGDVKPANIIVDHTGKPWLTDFGLAGPFAVNAGQGGTIAGSALYLSPEQALGNDIDGRADLYSMGVILFEMAAGVLPVVQEGAEEMIRRKQRSPETIFLKRPRDAAPGISEPLERVILKATAPNPADRYPDGIAFAKDLAALGRS